MRSKVYVGEASVGRGLLARYPIEPRETILFITGPVVSFAESLSLPDEGENTVQIGQDAYVDPLFPGRFLNHSCEPNAGLIDETCLIALRQIKPGEEIRYDYSTALLERFWSLECHCGAKECRGSVGDFDQLPKKTQQNYLRLGIVQSFIVDAINAQEGNLSLAPLPSSRVLHLHSKAG